MSSDTGGFAGVRAHLRRHPQIADGALAAALWILSANSVYYLTGGLALLQLLLVLPLVFRRWAPFPAAVATGFITLFSVVGQWDPSLANISALIVIYTVASRVDVVWQRWTALAAGLAGCFLLAVLGLEWRTGFSLTEFVLLLILTVGSWMLGDLVRRRRLVESRQREQERALAREQTQRIELVSQRERATIAREMHDIVAHSLSVVVVQSDGGAYAAKATLARTPTDSVVDREALERAVQTLETVAATARSALADTRRLVGVLRESGMGAEYAPNRGLAHLDTLVENLRSSGIPVAISIRGQIDDLTPDADLAAYRVIQESLTNVLKHGGPAARVAIDILRSPAVLMIRIIDDGLGDSAAPHDDEGSGLMGMTERVEVLGGTLYAGPRAEGGFEVVASLPVARVVATDPLVPGSEADTATTGPQGYRRQNGAGQ